MESASQRRSGHSTRIHSLGADGALERLCGPTLSLRREGNREGKGLGHGHPAGRYGQARPGQTSAGEPQGLSPESRYSMPPCEVTGPGLEEMETWLSL